MRDANCFIRLTLRTFAPAPFFWYNPIGIWGQRHLRYIKKHKQALYSELLMTGKLNSYIADINRQAEDMLLRLVEEMAKSEGVTEQLRVDNQMGWIQQMNNIRQRAIEIINSELIYT